MTNDVGRVLTDQALVSDEAPAGLHPSGFDPSREYYRFTNGWTMARLTEGWHWKLWNEAGEIVDRDQYRHDLIERHRLRVALHFEPANPWLRDSDGNPKGEDGTASSRSDDSAGPQGIAGKADA